MQNSIKYSKLTPTRLVLSVTPSALSQSMVHYATMSTVQITCSLDLEHTCTGDTTSAAGISTELLIRMLDCLCVLHIYMPFLVRLYSQDYLSSCGVH